MIEDPELREKVNARFTAYSHVSDYFPVSLDNGAVVRGVMATCNKCHKNIMPELFKGEVRPSPGSCYRITAIGWCTTCEMLTPFLFYLRPMGDDSFELRNMQYRGWMENFSQNNVVCIDEGKAKRRRRKNRKTA